MSAYVPVRDLFGLLLPHGCENGWLAMLKANFDDSGTHDQSEIVVVGGVMGTESELLSLDGMWRAHLENPLSGLKPPIREFHATDCFNSTGEFVGWKRTETDYFRRQLREVIIKSHVSGYGFSCIRKDWDAEMQGDIRKAFGDPEGYAITSCFVRALKWANAFTFDPEISFVFDKKPERERETKAIFDAFQLHEEGKSVFGIAFLDSKKVMALQAADLFAWEFNQYAQEILRHGMKPPTRSEMKHLVAGMYFIDGQIARIDRIKQMKEWAQQEMPDTILASAKYFGEFRGGSMGPSSAKKKARRVRKPPA